MPVFLFVIGVVLFLGFGFLVVMWIYDGIPEDYFYRSLGCISGMATLSIFFNIWGNYVFTIQAQKWILFSISIILILFIIFYFIGYIVICINDFEPRLLLMCLPALVEIYFVVTTFYKVDFDGFFQDLLKFLQTRFFLLTITLLVIVLSSVYIIILTLKLRGSNDELNYFKNYIHKNSDINFTDWNIINCSQSDRSKLEHAIMALYTFSQHSHLSPSRTRNILQGFDVPLIFSNRIIDRIFETNLYLKASSISMLEFAQVI